jgi:CheY-like chemotaxis protein/HPt (histidine-containing phosphotransfer) domain-containing protein
MPEDFEGVKVLIVDDNDTNRLVVASLLKHWGCRMSQSVEGALALGVLAKAARVADPFDVVLLDSGLSRAGGLELARQINTAPGLKRTALLLMTCPASRGDDAVWAEVPVAGRITKPVLESRLRAGLHLALARPNTAGESDGNSRAKLQPADPPRPEARILVAEDIAANREVALALLARLGYKADTATNGAEALAAMGSRTYDLVFMDCEMPVMDGYEATRRIRLAESAADGSHIPIVALTAHAISGDKEQCTAAGMDDYLAKPISLRRMSDALTKWLAGPPSVHQPESKVSAPAGAAKGVFNEEELLERLMNNRTLVTRVIGEFIRDAPSQISDLEGRLKTGDAVEARRYAHGLRGAAATVSSPDMAAVAEEIEHLAQAGDLGRAAQAFPRLVDTFEKLKTELKKAGWA